ncbi:MAG: hypothetical protein H6926_05235 [Chromatiales bacterium]|nr:hypothetical protein [Chromatiales bacterium]
MMQNRFNGSLSPLQLALLYAVLSLGTSVIFASAENRLFDSGEALVKGVTYVIHPFVDNLSTIFDFLILNPLVLYFLAQSRLSTKQVVARHGRSRLIPPYHRFGLLFLSIALAVKAMLFYFDGFLGGHYFDAVIAPNESGLVQITLTGWVVFFWTSLFISLLFYQLFQAAWYTVFVVSLRSSDIVYEPFHPDGVGGLAYTMRPILDLIRAMGILLIIFMVFYLHDFFVHEIHESKRIYGFVIYIGVVTPLVLAPLIHVHRLMEEQRDKLVKTAYSKLENRTVLPVLENLDFTDQSKAKLIDDAVSGLRNYAIFLRSLPCWPMPVRTMIESLSGPVSAALPIAYEILVAGSQAQGILGS